MVFKGSVVARWEALKLQLEQRQIAEKYRLMQIGEIRIEELQLSNDCAYSLRQIGVFTVADILSNFPYNPETNCLDGITLEQGIDEEEYQEIWASLYAIGALVRFPELPDIDEQREREKGQNFLTQTKLSDIGVPKWCCIKLQNAGVESIKDLLDFLVCDLDAFCRTDTAFACEAADKLYKIQGIGGRTAEIIMNAMYNFCRK